MFDITLIGLLQVLGQLSIYFVVLNFKQHMFPLVATTRKVFTVLLSIFIFNHKMNIYQWIALVMVFGGMGYELFDELYS
jgi:UDP-galactose transporter B1